MQLTHAMIDSLLAPSRSISRKDRQDSPLTSKAHSCHAEPLDCPQPARHHFAIENRQRMTT